MSNLVNDLVAVKQGTLLVEEFVETHFDELYNMYLSNGEMPYGVAKARTGDPYSWLENRVMKAVNWSHA